MRSTAAARWGLAATFTLIFVALCGSTWMQSAADSLAASLIAYAAAFLFYAVVARVHGRKVALQLPEVLVGAFLVDLGPNQIASLDPKSNDLWILRFLCFCIVWVIRWRANPYIYNIKTLKRPRPQIPG